MDKERKLKPLFRHVMTCLGIAARDYPLKALADKLEKGESTIYAELNGQQGHKLGLETAVMIMHHTNDLKALDGIEAMFNRVAYKLPDPKEGKHSQVIRNLGHVLKESGELSEKVAEALEDGVLDEAEIHTLKRETQDIMDACAGMLHTLNFIIQEGNYEAASGF